MKTHMRNFFIIFLLLTFNGCVHYGYTFSPDRFVKNMPSPDSSLLRRELFDVLLNNDDLGGISKYLEKFSKSSPLLIDSYSLVNYIRNDPRLAHLFADKRRFQFLLADWMLEDKPFYVDYFANLNEGNIGNSIIYIFYDSDLMYVGFISLSLHHRVDAQTKNELLDYFTINWENGSEVPRD